MPKAAFSATTAQAVICHCCAFTCLEHAPPVPGREGCEDDKQLLCLLKLIIVCAQQPPAHK